MDVFPRSRIATEPEKAHMRFHPSVDDSPTESGLPYRTSKSFDRRGVCSWSQFLCFPRDGQAKFCKSCKGLRIKYPLLARCCQARQYDELHVDHTFDNVSRRDQENQHLLARILDRRVHLSVAGKRFLFETDKNDSQVVEFPHRLQRRCDRFKGSPSRCWLHSY